MKSSGRGSESSEASPDQQILEAIRRIVQALDVTSRRLMSELGVTSTQLNCLAAIDEMPESTAREVADRIHVGTSTLVGVLDRLEDKDLITRERDASDRRRVLLRATHAGRELLERAPSPLGDVLHQKFRRLPRSEQRSLADAVGRVAELVTSGDS